MKMATLREDSLKLKSVFLKIYRMGEKFKKKTFLI